MFWHAGHFDAQHASIASPFTFPLGYFASHAAMHCSTVCVPPEVVPPEVVPPEVVPPEVVPPFDDPPLEEPNVPGDPLLELLDESSLLEHATRSPLAAARRSARVVVAIGHESSADAPPSTERAADPMPAPSYRAAEIGSPSTGASAPAS
jgi:hypothetical protein